jgi:hypothetical protein
MIYPDARDDTLSAHLWRASGGSLVPPGVVGVTEGTRPTRIERRSRS